MKAQSQETRNSGQQQVSGQPFGPSDGVSGSLWRSFYVLLISRAPLPTQCWLHMIHFTAKPILPSFGFPAPAVTAPGAALSVLKGFWGMFPPPPHLCWGVMTNIIVYIHSTQHDELIYVHIVESLPRGRQWTLLSPHIVNFFVVFVFCSENAYHLLSVTPRYTKPHY